MQIKIWGLCVRSCTNDAHTCGKIGKSSMRNLTRSLQLTWCSTPYPLVMISSFWLIIWIIPRPCWLRFTTYCTQLKQEWRSLILAVLLLPHSWLFNKARERRERIIPNPIGKGKRILESLVGQRESPISMSLMLLTRKRPCAFIVPRKVIGR